jgi:hypothetical protein
MDSQPIAFEYTPNNPDILFFPTMDSHDGGVPKKDQRVVVEHNIITVLENQDWGVINFNNNLTPEFLKKIYGTYALNGNYMNGDIFLDLKQNMSQPNLTRSF